jgi:hypothetical protein
VHLAERPIEGLPDFRCIVLGIVPALEVEFEVSAPLDLIVPDEIIDADIPTRSRITIYLGVVFLE